MRTTVDKDAKCGCNGRRRLSSKKNKQKNRASPIQPLPSQQSRLSCRNSRLPQNFSGGSYCSRRWRQLSDLLCALPIWRRRCPRGSSSSSGNHSRLVSHVHTGGATLLPSNEIDRKRTTPKLRYMIVIVTMIVMRRSRTVSSSRGRWVRVVIRTWRGRCFARRVWLLRNRLLLERCNVCERVIGKTNTSS